MPTILLVEDNLNLAEIIVRDLSANAFEVTHAAGGRDALVQLARRPYDAMILDWMLPDLDGLEVLRHMQAEKSTVPVLMLTARADEADRVIGLEVGADDYLTKPFSMRELVACLHALLRRVEKARQMFAPEAETARAVVQWGAVTIDTPNHHVQVAGQEVDLTPIEFALLDCLVRNPGRTFNRAYLMETIWEQAYIPGDRSVDNAVLRLRRKIYPHGEGIEAVWGVGYRLRGRS
ncbi:MAG: response regulator transcription factor [Anaerolineaceae bacterium]|nr:response regulator transcription factor [Anaerolineaceae bacterium]